MSGEGGGRGRGEERGGGEEWRRKGGVKMNKILLFLVVCRRVCVVLGEAGHGISLVGGASGLPSGGVIRVDGGRWE